MSKIQWTDEQLEIIIETILAADDSFYTHEMYFAFIELQNFDRHLYSQFLKVLEKTWEGSSKEFEDNYVKGTVFFDRYSEEEKKKIEVMLTRWDQIDRIKINSDLFKESKMTMLEIAREVGINTTNLSRIKNNKIKALRFSTLIQLCKVLGCTVAELLYCEGPDD